MATKSELNCRVGITRSMSHLSTSGVSSPSRLPAVMHRKLPTCRWICGRILSESQRSSSGIHDGLQPWLIEDGTAGCPKLEARQTAWGSSTTSANCPQFHQFALLLGEIAFSRRSAPRHFVQKWLIGPLARAVLLNVNAKVTVSEQSRTPAPLIRHRGDCGTPPEISGVLDRDAKPARRFLARRDQPGKYRPA